MIAGHRIHQALPTAFVPDIMLDKRGNLTQLIGRGLAGLAIEFGNNDLGAFFRQACGGGPSNTGAAPCHNGDLAFHSAHINAFL